MRGAEIPRFERDLDSANRTKKALELVEKTYGKDTEIIEEKGFEDLYSKETVERDLDWVRKEEERFEREDTPEQKEARKISTIFETLIYDQAEMSEWLGRGAITIKSSRYDDIKNGIDLIIEFPDSEETSASHLALAVDITLSSELEKKMNGIKRDIEHGKLSTVKYFKSETLDIRGEKKDVPKVIIGADSKMLNTVIDLWMQQTGESKDELGSHPIQFVLLEEIMMQLEKFRDYAEKIKQGKISENYEKVLGTMNSIMREKLKLREEVLGNNESVIENDRVFRAINSYLDKLGE
jgi:hypothetical protein